MYAYSLGCKPKYCVAALYCHPDRETSELGKLPLQLAFTSWYPFSEALIVDIGTKEDTEGCMGSALAYTRSKRKVSNASNTTSMLCVVAQNAPSARAETLVVLDVSLSCL